MPISAGEEAVVGRADGVRKLQVVITERDASQGVGKVTDLGRLKIPAEFKIAWLNADDPRIIICRFFKESVEYLVRVAGSRDRAQRLVVGRSSSARAGRRHA